MKWLTEWAITSSVLILIFLTVRFFCKDKLSARLRYALWAVVLVRLLVPFQVELPAAASQNLPLVASNFAPNTPRSWEQHDIPVFPTDIQKFEDTEEYQYLEPGVLSSTHWSMGYVQRSDDGETLTFYFDLFSRSQVVQMVWCGGVLVMGIALLVSNLYFALRLWRRRKRLEVPDVSVPVYTVEGLPSLCLFGVFRPAVYVTPEAAENLDTLRHVLAHELTHRAHFDHLWSLLRCLALALHWYNPLVWLAVILSKRDGELACDEGAVARLGEAERIPYGRTLVDMVAKRSARPADLLSCSTTMTGGKKSIQQRVARLVKKPETVKTALFAAVAVVAVAVVFVFAGRGEEMKAVGAFSPEFEVFLAQVEQVQQINIGKPLFSSSITPSEISDPDLLTQAKELLRNGRGVFKLEEGVQWEGVQASLSDTQYHDREEPEGITQEELKQMFFERGRPLNLFPTANQKLETAYRYWLIPCESGCLLVQWDAEREEASIEPLGYYSFKIIDQLKELARQQDKHVRAALMGDLTQEQIDRINEVFRPDLKLSDGSYGPSEISCFFTSSYDSPTQIDLKQFLMYCPLAEEVTKQQSPEEYREILEISWAEEIANPDFFMPVPVWRYPREKVSALLQKYAGVTVEELNWDDMLYLEEYDAFYNFTSDFGPGFFPCTGGQITDDTILLWSDPNENGDRCELTLRKSGDRWLIQAHHTIYTR